MKFEHHSSSLDLTRLQPFRETLKNQTTSFIEYFLAVWIGIKPMALVESHNFQSIAEIEDFFRNFPELGFKIDNGLAIYRRDSIQVKMEQFPEYFSDMAMDDAIAEFNIGHFPGTNECIRTGLLLGFAPDAVIEFNTYTQGRIALNAHIFEDLNCDYSEEERDLLDFLRTHFYQDITPGETILTERQKSLLIEMLLRHPTPYAQPTWGDAEYIANFTKTDLAGDTQFEIRQNPSARDQEYINWFSSQFVTSGAQDFLDQLSGV